MIHRTRYLFEMSSLNLEPDNKHKNEPLEEGDPQVYIISNILDVYIYMGKHTKMELAIDSRIICMTQDFEDQEIRL